MSQAALSHERPMSRTAVSLLILGLLMAVVFIAGFAVPYLVFDPAALSRFEGRTFWIWTHVAAGTVALLTGPVLIWLGLKTKTPGPASSAGVRLPRSRYARQPRRLLPGGDDRGELGLRNGSRRLGSRVGDHEWAGIHRHRAAHDRSTPGVDDTELRDDVRIRHVSSFRRNRDGDERRYAHRTAQRGRLVLLGRASADHGSRHPGKEGVTEAGNCLTLYAGLHRALR